MIRVMCSMMIFVFALSATAQTRPAPHFSRYGFMNCSVNQWTRSQGPGAGLITTFWEKKLMFPKNGLLQFQENIVMRDLQGRPVTVPLRLNIRRIETDAPPAPGLPKSTHVAFLYQAEIYNFLTGRLERTLPQPSPIYGEFNFIKTGPGSPGEVVGNNLFCTPMSF